MLFRSDKSWYSWNITNWGCKWDVAVADNDEYPETELIADYPNGENQVLVYKFMTPWGIAEEAMITLSKQFPTLLFTLSFEEETGWGGEIEFLRGQGTVLSDYGWRCRECGHEEVLGVLVRDVVGVRCRSCRFGQRR